MVPAKSMSKHLSNDDTGQEQLLLNFVGAVRRGFVFLVDSGFTEVESSPSLVRFRKGDVDAAVYFDRVSYELGFVVSHEGVNCSLGQMIRVVEPEAGKNYRDFAATTQDALTEGIGRLEELTKLYGQRALQGDPEFFADFEIKRKSWVHEYALEVLEGQLRPKADEAFRRGDYRDAAELYERIRPRLNAAELKKLAIATERDRA